eukprot:comp23445_c1_seq1/m.39113 comp23445_c1_seq1/g.39113  ORF comp23445_c1_seq1/g.39113 comp23445_c1_seq1/m.39113 type:complete len:787 (-) comp23445_c1_seq1:505-2865(-)
MAADAETVALLTNVFGQSESKIKETVKNEKLTQTIRDICAEAGITSSSKVSKGVSNLLYNIATRLPPKTKANRRPVLVKYVVDEKITTDTQLTAAFDFFKDEELTGGEQLDTSAFDQACGVGVVVTPEQVKAAAAATIEAAKPKVVEDRYHYPLGSLLTSVRAQLKWADPRLVKEEVDAQVLALLGPKTEADTKKPKEAKPKQKKEPAATGEQKKDAAAAEPEKTFSGVVNMLHKPGENYKMDGYVVTPKTKELLAKHLKETGGQVRTRFPPEPNGILHIGHAKAMNFNFSYAKANNGVCFLRYDDTNPEAEEERYFSGILDMVRWLGWEPFQITHSSDYFPQLYAWAVELIKRGLAYIDHQTAEQIKEERGGSGTQERRESPWRNRPIEENLRIFEEMRQGLWEEGKACLRMKMDMTSGNPMMWDIVAYRVKFCEHVKSGNEWCIYPTYDFTHCLCDSIENISHSLCTVEFKQSRESYYWLCNALDVYCPVQWEYARLNLTNTVLSKRKILKLIAEGVVRDWDDPRLHTLPALRRRGFTPEAINAFCEKVGITTSLTVIDSAMLESCLRDDLNLKAIRVMAVLEPLKVTLVNYPADKRETVEVENIPFDPSKGKHTISFTGTVFIEQSDFREVMEKGYRRLTPDQPVGLKHRGVVIKVQEAVRDSTGKVCELKCTYEELTADNKPKTFIHWVSDPIAAEVRWYDPLLKDDSVDDEESAKDFMSQVNKESLRVMANALVDQGVKGCKPQDKFQFERQGYFCVDPDSTPERPVFNLTVTLKEDNKKN